MSASFMKPVKIAGSYFFKLLSQNIERLNAGSE